VGLGEQTVKVSENFAQRNAFFYKKKLSKIFWLSPIPIPHPLPFCRKCNHYAEPVNKYPDTVVCNKEMEHLYQ